MDAFKGSFLVFFCLITQNSILFLVDCNLDDKLKFLSWDSWQDYKRSWYSQA